MTSWIAVRDRSPQEVAEALKLTDRESLGWAEGADRAYKEGVFVGAPVGGWTLAHGAVDLMDGLGHFTHDLHDLLSRLGGRLGTQIQLYRSDRVSSIFAWGCADGESVLRVFWFEDGEVIENIGELTPVEEALGIGHQEQYHRWEDDEVPYGGQVLAIAGSWSVDPSTLDETMSASVGVFGVPPPSEQQLRLKAALAAIDQHFGGRRA